MASVVGRIRQIKQPYGGYLPTKAFQRTIFDDGMQLCEEENIHSSLVGLAVDYLTRFMQGERPEKAFEISLLGARIINEQALAHKMLSNIKGLNDASIVCACRLAGFDVCYRKSPASYKPVKEINPDSETINNIRIMVQRTLSFFAQCGQIVASGFTFEGGYTDTVNAGDGDFCTRDTLWDMKVSKEHIKPAHTLQILMYYIMGLHSKHAFFKDIEKLGFFNPRRNTVYICPISTIPQNIIQTVEKEVIGYGQKIYRNTATESFPENGYKDLFTISEICEIYNIPKKTIYKAIHNGVLHASKIKNKYVIKKEDIEAYIRRMKIVQIVSVSFAICILVAVLIMFISITAI